MSKVEHKTLVEPDASRSLIMQANEQEISRSELIRRYIREGLERDGALKPRYELEAILANDRNGHADPELARRIGALVIIGSSLGAITLLFNLAILLRDVPLIL